MDVGTPLAPGSTRFRRLAKCFRLPDHDIDDVVQETWLRILEHRGRLAFANDAVAYAEAMLRNEARKGRREAARRGERVTPLQDLDPPDERPDPEAIVMARDRSAVLWRLIDKLNDTSRVVFIEHELCGFTLSEIAQAHGLPESTVKERLYLAWSKVEQEKARWQAAQRRRRQPTVPCWIPLLPYDRTRGGFRPFLRLVAQGASSAAMVLLTGALPPQGSWGGCGATSASAPGSRLASAAREKAPSAVEDHGRDLTVPVDTIGREAQFLVKTAENEILVARTGAATRVARPEGPRDGEHPLEGMLIERARAMLRLGTPEGELWACRLLDEHRARYGRGALAPNRDALRRRARCERDTLTHPRVAGP